METNIQEAAHAIKSLSAELISSVRGSLKDLNSSVNKRVTNSEPIHRTESVTSDHILAWIGAAAFVTGGIAWSCAAAWGKWVLFSGVAAASVDYLSTPNTKTPQTSFRPSVSIHQTLPLSKRYEIVQKLSQISESIEKRWYEKANSLKEGLLEFVDSSVSDEKNAVDAKYKLYAVEQISHNMDEWLQKFESAEKLSDIHDLIVAYGVYFVGQIEDACQKQLLAYTQVGDLLKS